MTAFIQLRGYFNANEFLVVRFINADAIAFVEPIDNNTSKVVFIDSKIPDLICDKPYAEVKALIEATSTPQKWVITNELTEIRRQMK